MSGRSTYQRGQRGGFRGGEKNYQGRGNSGDHRFVRSKQSKTYSHKKLLYTTIY